MKVTKAFLMFAVTFLVSINALGVAHAEGYAAGDKINVLIGFKPGGGSDNLAQLVEPFLAKAMNVTFVNQYVPGAAGAIAWTKLGNSTKNDGYTISITNSPMIVANYLLNSDIKYNVKQFEPLANVVTDPGVLVVGKDSPFKTAVEFFAAAKATPDKLTVGNSGIGGDDFFSSIFLENLTGVTLKKVPFKGDGPSMTAAMGGKIDASSNNLGTVYQQIAAGNLRALAIYATKRNALIPDVPTMKELGYELDNGSSRGFSAPVGIPADKRAALIAGFKKVLADPEFLAEAERRAQIINPILGDDYKKMLFDMEVEYKPIVDSVK